MNLPRPKSDKDVRRVIKSLIISCDSPSLSLSEPALSSSMSEQVENGGAAKPDATNADRIKELNKINEVNFTIHQASFGRENLILEANPPTTQKCWHRYFGTDRWTHQVTISN